MLFFSPISPFTEKFYNCSGMCGIIALLPPLDWYGKGVNCVELFISFFISVMASVVAYYVCKWLDSDK